MAKQAVENREAFMARMRMFYPEDQAFLAMIFYDLLKGRFRHIFRKSEKNADGTPKRYFEHLRGVALILLDEAGLINFILTIVALGHDAVEDTRTLLREITLLFGLTTLGPEISKRIALCSKVPEQGFMKRLEMLGDWIVLAAKIADRIYNLRTLGDNAEFRAKQIKETQEEYLKLADLMVERAPEGAEREGCMRLRTLFHATLAAESAR